MRCPNTTTPRQHLGRKRYRLARREMRCVREMKVCAQCEGTGWWGGEMCPECDMTGLVAHDEPCAFELQALAGDDRSSCPVATVQPAPAQVAKVAGIRTPEQIAASDARYREHLRRRSRGE